MIYLTQDLLFRKGAQRACYRHPLDASLCIKILHDPEQDGPGEREAREEIAYYALLQRRGISWEMLPLCHGQVETNFGTGTVFDLVRDRDGNISRPFFEFLKNPELTRLHLHDLAQSLGSLADYLLRERIITKNLKQRNLVYQIRDQGPGRMFLVDDIGDTDFIPLSRFCKLWAEKKIQRKWSRFEKHLLRSFAHNPWIGELIAKIRVTRRSGKAKHRSCQI